MAKGITINHKELKATFTSDMLIIDEQLTIDELKAGAITLSAMLRKQWQENFHLQTIYDELHDKYKESQRQLRILRKKFRDLQVQ